MSGGEEAAEERSAARRRSALARGIAAGAAVGCVLTVGILLWGPQREPERSPSCEEIADALLEVGEDLGGYSTHPALVEAGLDFEVRIVRLAYDESLRAAAPNERPEVVAEWRDGLPYLIDGLLDEVDCPPAP